MIGRWLVLLCLAAGVVGCGRIAPPQLVRDGASLFGAGARQAAEARLQSLADEYGVWVFVVTEPGGDPPRMMDGLFDEADAYGIRAVALLYDQERSVGSGFSEAAVEHDDTSSLPQPDVERLLALGEGDAALAVIVETAERWLADPPPARDAPAPLPVIEQPSSVPVA